MRNGFQASVGHGRLRRLAGAVALALALLIVTAQAGTAQAVVTGVFPAADCVNFDQDHNTITALFGYASANDGNVIIPVGPNNQFSPPPINRGQPTVFFTGINHQAFSATFFPASSAITWSLLGNQLTADMSDSHECVTPATAPQAVRGPTVHGTPFVGQALSVDPGVYKNDVGDVQYQWQRPDGAGGWAGIAGATASTYTPAAGDAGKALRVEVTVKSGPAAIGDGGGVTTEDSSPTEPVGAPPTGVWPTVSGAALPGRRLTAHPGAWTGVSSFTYDWQRCVTTCVSTGVTTPTYNIGRADLLRGLRVVIHPSGLSDPTGVSAELFVL